ncbi:MAG: hypothetical protein HC905_27775 [Bacteroidales bacterium]|nr:hypothetical protein [Bacteroidales bacterium]
MKITNKSYEGKISSSSLFLFQTTAIEIIDRICQKISENLIGDLRFGREEAYNQIFKNYFPRLCQFATTYLLDEAVAKNLIQDVFLKLWENRQELRENVSIMSYLLTITKNKCLDYIRHQKIENKHKEKS